MLCSDFCVVFFFISQKKIINSIQRYEIVKHTNKRIVNQIFIICIVYKLVIRVVMFLY